MVEQDRDRVVLDATVLINFLKIDRVDLLAGHPHYQFIVTDHVAAEISDLYPEQKTIFDDAIASSGLLQVSLTSEKEIQEFVELEKLKRLGDGECAALAYASTHELPIAVDDIPAQKAAKRRYKSISILTTKDLMIDLIQASIIDITTADEIKHQWEHQHRFKMLFGSFAELL